MSGWGLLAAIFGVSLLRVYARATQQLQVVNFKWRRIPAYSYLMAASDVVLWGSTAHFVVSHDWVGAVLAVILYGTAGWVGAMIAMRLYLRLDDE